MPHADPNERDAYHQAWAKRNVEKRRQYGRTTYLRRRKTHIQRCRERILRVKYGITEADYAEMLKRQGGVCGVCKRRQQSGRRLAVDHDHETGRVRGLLCQSCNGKLEKFLDYIREAERLETARPS